MNRESRHSSSVRIAAAALGIDVGWQPLPEGGMEYIIQIAPQTLETLKAGESGLLFMREGHSVQFPQDIEVFTVAPPALDEIRRWQRNRLATDKADIKDEA
jgi:hypothetical protein